MKKLIKRGAALILFAVLCLSLCSCIDIKEMKASQAFYANNQQTEIIFGGKKYVQAQQWPEELIVDLPNYGRVTKEDVPVLLSDFTGDLMEYNEDKTIISCNGNNYFLEEKYYELSETVTNLEFDYYYIDSYDYNTHEYVKQTLSDETAAVMEDILNYTEPYFLNEGYWEFADCCQIYRCDKTKTFAIHEVVLCYTEGGVYFFLTNDFSSEAYYFIPTDKQHLFKELFPMNLEEEW